MRLSFVYLLYSYFHRSSFASIRGLSRRSEAKAGPFAVNFVSSVSLW
jgi:hypothetical protein